MVTWLIIISDIWEYTNWEHEGRPRRQRSHETIMRAQNNRWAEEKIKVVCFLFCLSPCWHKLLSIYLYFRVIARNGFRQQINFVHAKQTEVFCLWLLFVGEVTTGQAVVSRISLILKWCSNSTKIVSRLKLKGSICLSSLSILRRVQNVLQARLPRYLFFWFRRWISFQEVRRD